MHRGGNGRTLPDPQRRKNVANVRTTMKDDLYVYIYIYTCVINFEGHMYICQYVCKTCDYMEIYFKYIMYKTSRDNQRKGISRVQSYPTSVVVVANLCAFQQTRTAQPPSFCACYIENL